MMILLIFTKSNDTLDTPWKIAVFIVSLLVISIIIILTSFFSLKTLYGEKTKKAVNKFKNKRNKKKQAKNNNESAEEKL